MIAVLATGIGIGVAVAAPVGPVGLLCIRRTLAAGRGQGLASGMGAAVADAIYGVLVATGFAASGLLLLYARPLQIGGGMLIALLGAMPVYAFLAAGPARAARDGPRGGLWAAFASTLAITLSNPMTILTFIALIAGMGASVSEDPAAPYWLVAGVFLGSAMWWLFLVHLALLARGRITPRLSRWFDLVSGGVLVIWGLWLAISAL